MDRSNLDKAANDVPEEVHNLLASKLAHPDKTRHSRLVSNTTLVVPVAARQVTVESVAAQLRGLQDEKAAQAQEDARRDLHHGHSGTSTLGKDLFSQPQPAQYSATKGLGLTDDPLGGLVHREERMIQDLSDTTRARMANAAPLALGALQGETLTLKPSEGGTVLSLDGAAQRTAERYDALRKNPERLGIKPVTTKATIVRSGRQRETVEISGGYYQGQKLHGALGNGEDAAFTLEQIQKRVRNVAAIPVAVDNEAFRSVDVDWEKRSQANMAARAKARAEAAKPQGGESLLTSFTSLVKAGAAKVAKPAASYAEEAVAQNALANVRTK